MCTINFKIRIFVLDNTYLPCDGVAYDKITPWITILL